MQELRIDEALRTYLRTEQASEKPSVQGREIKTQAEMMELDSYHIDT